MKTQTYLFINGHSGPAVDGVVTQSRFIASIRTSSVYGPLLDDALTALPEILAAPVPPETDTIELKNLTDREIDLTGWFLSDNSANYRKYHFPNNSNVSHK